MRNRISIYSFSPLQHTLLVAVIGPRTSCNIYIDMIKYYIINIYNEIYIFCQKEKLNCTGEGRRAMLDLPSILFIKSRLHCMYFVTWFNLGILFHKISIDPILNSPNLLLSEWRPVLNSLFKAQIDINQKRFFDIHHFRL